MGDDDGERLCGVLGSVHADITDKIAGFINGFEALEGDVLEYCNLALFGQEKRYDSIPLRFVT